MLRTVMILLCTVTASYGQKFRMLVLAEHDKNHTPYVLEGKPWLYDLARENDFAVYYVKDT